MMVDNMESFKPLTPTHRAVRVIPNVVFAMEMHKKDLIQKLNNKYVEVMEQVGRLGSFQIHDIPYSVNLVRVV